MKITMYELLGMVKDGKAPKKVMYEGILYFYDPFTRDYYEHEEKTNLFHGVNRELNREVEIIEEENKIPDDLYYLFTMDYNDDLHEVIKKSNINFKNICEKLDKILDYLKSKGNK